MEGTVLRSIPSLKRFFLGHVWEENRKCLFLIIDICVQPFCCTNSVLDYSPLLAWVNRLQCGNHQKKTILSHFKHGKHCFAGDRGSGGGFGKSDRGGGGGSSYGGQGDMEIQQDTIFVSGMGEDCTEEAMVQHFGSIGVIKVGLL